MSGRRSQGDLNDNGIPDSLERGNNFNGSDLNGNGIPDQFEGRNIGNTYRSEVLLPTRVIEKAAAVHEEIRREQVEEIQPIVNVEKLKTEVHQVTQPLFDREVRAVGVSEKTLPTQILPEVHQPNVGLRSAEDVSTVQFRDAANMVIEKPAVYMETQKKQIIEEIQPVIYKETIVPTLIKETKPIYQTVVEGVTYSQTVLPAQQLSSSNWASRINSTSANSTGWENNSMQRGGLNDLNGNDIPDSMERKNFSSDLNGNGIPDKLETTTTSSTFTSTTSNTPYSAV